MLHRVLLLGLAGLCLSAQNDPQQVLSRLRDRITGDLRRIPNYTCVESVRREYFRPSVTPAVASCATRGASTLQPWSVDQLRLDVAVTPAREIYSWAGAREFDDRELTEIIGGGPITTGEFSAFLSAIFGSADTQFTYLDETGDAGRPLMRLAYRIPQAQSSYRVRAGDGWVITGYEGEVVVDPESVDLVRLTIGTGALPPSTGSCETRIQFDYRRVAIGDMDLLLPATTRQRFVLRNGAESENTSTFSSCREYRGESTVRFPQESPSESIAATVAPASHDSLPGDLPVILDLGAPLDTWTASGGEMISLRLAKPIVGAARQVLVPAGAAIQARLLRVQRFFTKPERVTVVVAPETIERAGARLPFSVSPAPHNSFRTGLSLRDDAATVSPTPAATRFAEFHFVGDHVVVPKGYHTMWHTAAILNP